MQPICSSNSLLNFIQVRYAVNPETRRRAIEGSESRLEINVPILSKALDIRRQLAAILGYETWADYIIEVKMAGTAKAANEVRRK